MSRWRVTESSQGHPGNPATQPSKDHPPGKGARPQPRQAAISGCQLTDLQVLAFLSAKSGPRGTVTLGCRTIGEQLGVSKDTISRSLTRLQREGRIELVPGRNRLTDAESWRVLTPIDLPLDLDLWSKDGLGCAAGILIYAMEPNISYASSDLATMTGLSQSRTKRALKVLHSVGWASPTRLTPEGHATPHTKWFLKRVTHVDVEEVADLLHVPQKRLARRRQHLAQRIKWADLVEPWTERTAVLHTAHDSESHEGIKPSPSANSANSLEK